MVIAKPIHVTKVSAEPLIACGACSATRVENSGESAISESPHTNKKNRNNINDGAANIHGATMQQVPDTKSANAAVLFNPNFGETYPATAHAMLPAPITRNESIETLIEYCGCAVE